MNKIIFLSTLFFICACSSSAPKIKYYLLDDKPKKVSFANNRLMVRVSPITTPSYLKQSKLVLKTDTNQIIFANYHLWAEDIAQAIRRTLTYQLNEKSSKYFYSRDCTKCKDLKITIDHFYPTDRGSVYLVGYYEYKKIKESFYFEESIKEDGYGFAVQSMRDLIVKLALDIRKKLAK